MNTDSLSTLTWNELIQPSMIGKKIMISYWGVDRNFVFSKREKVTVLGTEFYGNKRLLLVNDGNDICIILKDGIGNKWFAYSIFEGDE